jgi:hypothetical protein
MEVHSHLADVGSQGGHLQEMSKHRSAWTTTLPPATMVTMADRLAEAGFINLGNAG